MGPYQSIIIEHLGCCPEDAVMIEDIMRQHIFHSTLDWQSKEKLQRGAKEAWEMLEEEREMFEGYYREARQPFDEKAQVGGA